MEPSFALGSLFVFFLTSDHFLWWSFHCRSHNWIDNHKNCWLPNVYLQFRPLIWTPGTCTYIHTHTHKQTYHLIPPNRCVIDILNTTSKKYTPDVLTVFFLYLYPSHLNLQYFGNFIFLRQNAESSLTSYFSHNTHATYKKSCWLYKGTT
jgi:hypothetical protein